MANLGNPKNTIEIIQKYELMFQKKFGQNFLIDTHVLEKIISAAGITKNDCVLEIGPGIGTMTQYLAENAGHVVAVEIDRNLIPILKETLADYDNVTVINEDILRVDIKALAEEYNDGKPIKVVANLPYYITTPIIMGLFESGVPIDNITVMVQKLQSLIFICRYRICLFPGSLPVLSLIHSSQDHRYHKAAEHRLQDPRRRFKLSERHVNICSHKKRHQCILQSEIRELKPDLLSVFFLRHHPRFGCHDLMIKHIFIIC